METNVVDRLLDSIYPVGTVRYAIYFVWKKPNSYYDVEHTKPRGWASCPDVVVSNEPVRLQALLAARMKQLVGCYEHLKVEQSEIYTIKEDQQVLSPQYSYEMQNPYANV